MFDFIVRGTVFMAVVIVLGNGIYLAHSEQNTSAALCFAAAVLLLIFVFLSRFRKFRGFGIEAELWEDTKSEAEKLLRKLEASSVLQAKYLVRIGTQSGRFNSALSIDELYDLNLDIKKMMVEAGASTSEIEEQTNMIRWFIVSDIIRKITTRLQRTLERANSRAPDAAKLSEVKNSINKKIDMKRDVAELPQLLRNFVAEVGILTEDEKREFLQNNEKYLKAMENFIAHGSRPLDILS